METRIHKLPFSQLLPFAALAVLLSGLYLTGRSSLAAHSSMSTAISLDLLLSVPLIYLALIWKTGIPRTTVVPVMVGAWALGTFAIPAADQAVLAGFRSYALPIVELSVVAFIAWKARKSYRAYRKAGLEQEDGYAGFRTAAEAVLPRRAAALLAMELGVMYYGWIRWKKPVHPANSYTASKSGTSVLMGALLMLILVETFVLHVLVGHWYPVVAWVLTGLSLYTCLQVWGALRSIRYRPIRLADGHLILRQGILRETSIPVDAIESVEISRKPIPAEAGGIKLSQLGDLEGHNVIVHCAGEQVLHGLYGRREGFRSIAFFVDDKEGFAADLEAAIRQHDCMN